MGVVYLAEQTEPTGDSAIRPIDLSSGLVW